MTRFALPTSILAATCRGMAPSKRQKPKTPPPSQSLAPPSPPRSAPKQSSSSCAPGGTPCCSPPRRLALSSTCRNPGDKLLLAQAIRLGGHSDSMVCLARGLPARHIACPAHADLPEPLPCRLDRLPFWLGAGRAAETSPHGALTPSHVLWQLSYYCVLITHAWRAQVDVLRGSHRANLALGPTAFHEIGSGRS